MLPYMTHSGLAMSYLDNGSTLRSMFRLMPPQRHDADPDRSEVLAYIRENLRCELGRAIRAFNSMRNKKSQVIVYDMVHRQWRGCDWVPPEDEDKVSLLLRTINELKRDVAYLKTSVKKHERLFGQLERKRSRKREQEDEPDSEVEAQEEKSSPDVDPEELERKKREEEEAADRKAYNDYWGPIRAALAADQEASAPSVAPRSSPSDSTAPTQSPWENAEDEVS
jgi:hypothetical protein